MADPREHINEEPRNDLMDTGIGFALMFGVCFLIAAVATVMTLL